MKTRTRRLLTLLLIAAMTMSLMVPALAVNTAQSETPYTYDAGDYTFGKISHADKAPGTPDGIVDYTGDGTVAVTGTVTGADGQGDRGQSYSWAAMAYGDYVYVGTCYAAMGKTLSAMDSVMGHKFDEEVMRAELNAIFNGTFFYGEEDGGVSDGILVKINVHTGEVKLIMANSLNGVTPLFRNAILYKDKIYFCGSVTANGRVGLPSVYEVDPTDDSFRCVYTGLENMQEYVQAYKEGVCTGIRGMAVYDGKLVISNVGVDGGYLLISDNPSEGFTKIATQSDLCNYPAVHFVDSVYGGGIWEMVEYHDSLYVAMCTGTPATRVGDNMRSFAIVRGDCSGDWNDPAAWTWTPVVGDKADGAKYTFGIDPERTRAAACNLCIYDGYLYIGEYNDEEIPLEELMFSQDFGFLARNLEQSVNLYRMSIGSDGSEQMELVVGEATKMFPAGGILCKRSGFGDYENQYFWQSKVFDGKLFLGTFDTSSLLEPLGQFTNGDLLHMSRDEWASQIGYLKVLLKLLLDKNKNNGDGTLFAAGSGDAAAAIDAAVDAVNAESPELFTMTDTQYDTMRQALKDGVYDAPYSASTLRRLNELNALLDELTDLVETNDISGFVARYQKANDLYASLSGKLPDALKKLYEALVRITELENMKDLCICLKKLSTATRGFGLYTITSDNGKLTLETLTRDGFGDPYNHGLRAFATNDEQGWMVIGTANPFMGTQLWRTTVNTPDPMERFTDLNPFNWAYPGIRYCVTNGLMSGTSDMTFAPDAVMTRAQIVQVLYNLAGEPAVAGTTPFTDLTSDWYQDAVLWAYRTGVVAGTSDTTFDPDAPVTRTFSDCAALKEITIPASVTAIGDSAFSGCLALRTVHFGGSKEAWQAVEVGEHNTLLRLASVDYNAVTGHHFGDWTVTTEATCTEPGVRTRTCADAGCAEAETEAIPALGHDWGEGVTVAEPSGAQGGRVRTTCKRCGAESLRFTDPEIPAYQQFDDVDFALWSYPGIAFCVKTGLMSGTDTHTFTPKGVTTRAQIVQILYNLAGEPAVAGTTPFTDLTNDWYRDAVLWAYQTGVVAGTSATTFDPESPVTREQIAVILMGYADMVQHLKHTWTPADLSAFPDGASVSDWAQAAMADAVALELISGAETDDGIFLQPQGDAAREQVATILQSFCTRTLGWS